MWVRTPQLSFAHAVVVNVRTPQTVAVCCFKIDIEHFRSPKCALTVCAHTTDMCGASCHGVALGHRAVSSQGCALGPGVPGTAAVCFSTSKDSLAERSKAVAQGAIPKGRGFDPHSCHLHMQWL